MENILPLTLNQLAWNMCLGIYPSNLSVQFPIDIIHNNNLLFQNLIHLFTIILTYLHKLSISDIILSNYISFFNNAFINIGFYIFIYPYSIDHFDSLMSSRSSRIIYDYNTSSFTHINTPIISSKSLNELYSVYLYNNTIYKIYFDKI